VETGGGQVLWHCFVDPFTPVEVRLQENAHGNGARVSIEPDPAWDALQHLR
jgi:hypothetical protein